MVEKTMKIAYFGIPGSYSYFAAQKYFGVDAEYLPSKVFRDVFKQVQDEQAAFGVVPIENSLAGSVYENYDNLTVFSIPIIGEVYLPIRHCLLGVSGSSVENVKKVYAHPQALAQCSKFLDSLEGVEKVAFGDNASAAELVSKSENRSMCAIASEETGTLYGLEVLKRNIADNKENLTRFLVIGKELGEKSVNKASIMFTVAHKPGSLIQALQVLASYGLNLTKIESRPIAESPFEYRFYVDVEFDDRNIFESAVTALQDTTHILSTLGLYISADR